MYQYRNFTRLANSISDGIEHPLAFTVIACGVLVWMLIGVLSGFPDIWLTLFSIVTGIVTFLLLFIVQHNQSRFNLALHIKLNEIIRSTSGAHNALLDLEKLTDHDLMRVWAGYAAAAKQARQDLLSGRLASATACIEVETILVLIEEGTLYQPERLATLEALHLLDTPQELEFDQLTHAACRFAHAPVALVSLVDDRRQFFKSSAGLAAPWSDKRETPLSHSYCQYVVAAAKPLVVADVREHPGLRENLAVRDLNVVAYAGFPMFAPSGHTIGSFCAIDHEPHEWQAEEISVLQVLAHLATEAIAHRRRAGQSPGPIQTGNAGS